eukprot:EG_transcript_26742
MRLAIPSLLRCAWKPLRGQVCHFAAAPPDTPRRFKSYAIYKGRAALCVRLIPGQFKETPAGEALDRRGALLFELAPKVQGVDHQYDWKQKVSFAVNAQECGDILVGNFGDKGMSFVHDQTFRPGLEDSATPMKTLRVTKTPDGKGFFIAISTGSGTQLSVPVTHGEFEVLKVLTKFALPRMLGFEA